MTEHWALMPQEPGQGSTHLLLTHACVDGQSGLMTHSGRQFGGAPTYPGRHEQAGLLPLFWHWALGPQGEGTQGSLSCSTGGGGGGATYNKFSKPIFYSYNYNNEYFRRKQNLLPKLLNFTMIAYTTIFDINGVHIDVYQILQLTPFVKCLQNILWRLDKDTLRNWWNKNFIIN